VVLVGIGRAPRGVRNPAGLRATGPPLIHAIPGFNGHATSRSIVVSIVASLGKGPWRAGVLGVLS
jgi:hypothetical protein